MILPAKLNGWVGIEQGKSFWWHFWHGKGKLEMGSPALFRIARDKGASLLGYFCKESYYMLWDMSFRCIFKTGIIES